MKFLFSIFSIVLVFFWSAVVPTNAQVNVTQFHNHDSRDGLYIDSAFTQSAAANLTRDLNFDGAIVGNVYAQPLYLDNGPGGRAIRFMPLPCQEARQHLRPRSRLRQRSRLRRQQELAQHRGPVPPRDLAQRRHTSAD
jgi:hypothetical protein